MAWNYPVSFDSKQPFWACVVSPLTNRVFSFLRPCHNYSEIREWLSIYPVFVGCKFLNWGPRISHLRACKGEDDTFKAFNMEPISLLPENYILLGRKKVGLTYRWLLLNEENDLIRKKKSFYAKWTSKKRGPKRQSLYMICNNLSFNSCQCCCLTMGSMWWGVSKGSIFSLSPFCAGFHRMPAFWSM